MAHVHGGAVGKRLGVSIFLTFAFVAAEFVAGVFANSLALISDAAHNFADAFALILAWYAVRVSSRPATATKTFGYHRATILSALANAAALVVMAVWIMWEAIHRLQSPPEVKTGWVVAVALAAVAVNLTIGFWLHADAQHDLNVRAAFLHQVGDAMAAAGVFLAGLFISATGLNWIDPLVSLLIAGMILWTSRTVLFEAVDVLLESVPKGIDMAKLVHAIEHVRGVRGVHDLHVWSISSGMVACSCHVVVDDQSVRDGQGVQRAVAVMLEHDFGITHATIQVEADGCGVSGVHCEMRKAVHVHGHDCGHASVGHSHPQAH